MNKPFVDDDELVWYFGTEQAFVRERTNENSRLVYRGDTVDVTQ